MGIIIGKGESLYEAMSAVTHSCKVLLFICHTMLCALLPVNGNSPLKIIISKELTNFTSIIIYQKA
jgi:hypothetical protein